MPQSKCCLSLLRALLVSGSICAAASEALAVPTFTVSFDDPGGAYAGYYDRIRSHVVAAGNDWGQRLIGQYNDDGWFWYDSSTATIDLEIRLTTGTGYVAAGG